MAEDAAPQPGSEKLETPHLEGETEGGIVGGVIGGVLGGTVAGSTGPRLHVAAEAGPEQDTRPVEQEVSASEVMSFSEGNRFAALPPNPFVSTAADPVSTFAVDVDTASYTVWRRYLSNGVLPPAAAIRLEEHVNYFRYAYAPPTEGAFAVHVDGAPSPFTRGHHLVRIGVQGKRIAKSLRKPTHLTFLVDTSGSMADDDRLPLAREAIKIAVRNLNERDTVAIVTYAGQVGVALPPTSASDRTRIHAVLDGLRAEGGTAMGSGLELAYRQAVKKAAGGVTARVIVMTDGDTNLGPNLRADAMLESVQKYVREGVTLTMVGFGMGNYRDDLMERLANKGNGNCFYVDGLREARRVFETHLAGTLEVIAKDVKLQAEFDPAAVAEYRLLGYENRAIADHAFRDDKVDAGEIGAGHSVTALYELRLRGGTSGSLGVVRLRAKPPTGTAASEQVFTLSRAALVRGLDAATPDLRFAAAVAGAADILRHASDSGSWSLAQAIALARDATGGDPEREEFVRLLTRAEALYTAQRSVAKR